MAVKKQSGPKVSTTAGRIMRHLQKSKNDYFVVEREALETLCASVLSQDETKGQKHAPRKRKTS